MAIVVAERANRPINSLNDDAVSPLVLLLRISNPFVVIARRRMRVTRVQTHVYQKGSLDHAD